MNVYSDDNPSQMYMDAMFGLLRWGKEYAPRGKRIKELRPVVLEYKNPQNRVTFLKGRVINPFFQLAESLWIIAGRADVGWLTDYNKSIAQFSDDGKWFNAPYGERLRRWGDNSAREIHIRPVLDQLYDVYKKITADPDTRQAVAFIGNPSFDSSEYTHAGGKDIACNLNIKFKLRDGKLSASVDNRSNDLHWGTFGANLCQFATIQEAVASWLGVEVGPLYQITDSLHIYLDDYGAQETEKVLKAYDMYGVQDETGEWVKFDTWVGSPKVTQYISDTEPRFDSTYTEFHKQMEYYFECTDRIVRLEATYNNSIKAPTYWKMLNADLDGAITDPYLRMTVWAMIAYQAHKYGNFVYMIEALDNIPDCSWKVSCLRFLSKKYGEKYAFRVQYKHLEQDIVDYIDRKGE